VLDPREARKVHRVLFEDRPVPREGARRVAANDLLELGEALVGFDLGARIVGPARVLEQPFGEIGVEPAARFISLHGNSGQGRVFRVERHLSEPRRVREVPDPFELERREQGEPGAIGAGRRLGPLGPVARAVGGRLGGEALVQLAQREVGRARL
jgi:hypothetical protein